MAERMMAERTMDCREAKKLLPLWIGQDLPDATSTTEVARHLEKCSSCSEYRKSLQSSLEALQSSTAEGLAGEVARHGVWPKLVLQISAWEQNHRRERFNGWIPASVMALAVALMVAVSIPSIRDEFFSDGANLASSADLFAEGLDSGLRMELNPGQGLPSQGQAFGTPVTFKLVPNPEQKPNQDSSGSSR